MLKRNRVIGIALAAGMVAGFAPLGAQGPAGSRGPAGPHAGRSLGVLLEHAEELGLSQDQIAQLNEMKTVMEEEVTPIVEQMRSLRSAIQSGEVERDEGFRQMQELRGKLMTASAPLRGRIQEILTVEQHRQLQGLMSRGGRAGPGRGVVGAPRGRGGRWPRGLRGSRGGIGFRPGIQGQGRAPAFGFRYGPRRFPGAPSVRRPFRDLRWGGRIESQNPAGIAGLSPRGA